MIPVNIAYEDPLSGAVLDRVIEATGPRFAVGSRFTRGGFGYLKRTVAGFNVAARGMPWLVLTDLDNATCPVALREAWLNVPLHTNLLFRVAVREVESWILAHRIGFADFAKVRSIEIPKVPDLLDDPKAKLLALIEVGKNTRLKADVLPRSVNQKQGPGYNLRLIEFVQSRWDPAEARMCSPSLDRTLRRLEEFEPLWKD